MGSRPASRLTQGIPANNFCTDTRRAKSRKRHDAAGERMENGTYRGACGCAFHVRDNARVLYFDDPVLADIKASRRPSLWGQLRRLLCGSRGQAVRVQSRICCGVCVLSRGLCGIRLVPGCCLCACPGVAISYDIPVKVNH